MNIKLTLLLLLSTLTAFAQDDLTDKAKPIVAEGKLLYRSEMASWHGTDLFFENYKDHENVGGYFSYVEADLAKCIFFSKSDSPKVIGTIAFDSTYNVHTTKTDFNEREFNANEYAIYSIRKIALAEIAADTMFKLYKNTNLNLIPLIQGEDKKVYVLTGPKQNDVVIFGNDYLLTFDKDNNLTQKKHLHKSMIPLNYGQKDKNGNPIAGSMHTHLPETGEFITPTDICTLMLYEKFTGWHRHGVASDRYFSIWDCITNQLTIVLRDDVNKTNNSQEERKK